MGRGMGVGLELRGKTCSGIINPMDHTHDLNARRLHSLNRTNNRFLNQAVKAPILTPRQ